MCSTSPVAVRSHPSHVMMRVLILLALSAFINFVDRGNLSAAAPLLKTELVLSDVKLGILLAAFFWSYAMFQIASGWLVDHVDVKWMLAGGFFLWSVATAATGLAGGFALLLVARLVLGVGESVVYPSYSKILARYFPEDRRGFANSVIITGFYAGPAFGLFFGGILMGRFGWRSFFLVLGLLSLAWLLPAAVFPTDGLSPGRLQLSCERDSRALQWPVPPSLWFLAFLLVPDSLRYLWYWLLRRLACVLPTSGQSPRR